MCQKFDEFDRAGLVLVHVVKDLLQPIMRQIFEERPLLPSFNIFMTITSFTFNFVIVVFFFYFVKRLLQFINLNSTRIIIVHGQECLTNVHDVAVF